jgi:hypothetical protein
MSTFQICVVLFLAIFLVLAVIVVYRGGLVIRYEKDVTHTNINKLDEVQLAIARENLAELKKYNENATKNANDSSKAIQTITAAAQAFMGVSDDEEDRK